MPTTDLLRRKIGGIIFTLRTMGLYYSFREVIRRLFGIPYFYRGIEINTTEVFKLVNNLLYIDRNFGVDGDYYFIRTRYGVIYGKVPDIALAPGLEIDYLTLNVKDNVVIDVGAYLGETALAFLGWGAKMVYAYEPVPRFYDGLIKTIKANHIEGKVRAFNYGWWFDDGVLKVRLSFTSTGSLPGDAEIKVVNSTKELLKISREIGYDFVVKMDCEGCEYSLLTVPCEVLRLAMQYVIEIHGVALTPLIDKFTKCGFKYEVIKQVKKYLSIVDFTSY